MDEAYYWQWGKNLSLSYYDHPPMIALILAVSTFLSDSELFVRLPSIIGSVISSIIIYRFGESMFESKEVGFSSVVIANLTLIFCVGALFTTPDTPLIPFYLGGLLMLWNSVKAEPEDDGAWQRWMIAGLLIGGSLLSKYTAFFFYPCALIYLLASKQGRKWMAKPHPYVALLISFACFSPVIIWNAQNSWVSLSFQAGHGLSKSGGNPLSMFGEFLGFQVIVYSIGIFFFLLTALYQLFKNVFKKAPSKEKEASLFLLSFSLPVLFFFFANAFRARMEGNWPILGFLPLFIMAGAMVPSWRQNVSTRKRWHFSIGLAVFFLIFFHVQIVDPIVPHPQRREISRRVFGWKNLGREVDKVRETNSADFLIANRHQITGLMAYYTNPRIDAFVFDNNKYRYFFLPPTESKIGKNAIYLTEEERDQLKKVEGMFERVEKASVYTIERKGELIRRFILYRCYNYRGGLK